MRIPDQSQLFDIPDNITYLDCAAQSPSLRASHKAGERGLGHKLHPWDPGRRDLMGEIDRTRALFAELIGAAGSDIAHMTATSYGAAVAAQNLSLAPGQDIVVVEAQFPSNYYAWLKLAERDGGQVKIVPRPGDGDWTSAVLQAIDSSTGIVAMANCHWSDGGLIDLVPISDRVHEVSAAFFVDATQSIGARTFDVQRLNPDYVACSAYKWLLSPDSAGFLYVAPRRQNDSPIEDNHSTRIAESSMTVSAGYGAEYVAGAARFDQGAADSMIHIPMTMAALQQLLDWGVPAIEATLRPLTDRIAEEAEARGMMVPPRAHRVANFIGLRIKDAPADLDQQLRARQIFTSLRGGALRISPHLFNDQDDIGRLFEALDEVLA